MDDELKPLVGALNGMLARLSDAQQRQARFIANAAHQLRTPIAGVITQLDLAKSAQGDRDSHIKQAREGTARLARLAQQILSLAAADPLSNPGTPEERCDLAEIVTSHADEVAAHGALAWRGAGIRSQSRADDGQRRAGERARREPGAQLGTLRRRTVTVATRATEHESVLEVTDDGPGIPAGERERVFERFSRLDPQSTEGSGLGLAIVSEIAQRHRAAVELVDGPDGHVTRVAIAFPRKLS